MFFMPISTMTYIRLQEKRRAKLKVLKSYGFSHYCGKCDIKNMEKLIDMLEDNDDVQHVYHNWDNED